MRIKWGWKCSVIPEEACLTIQWNTMEKNKQRAATWPPEANRWPACPKYRCVPLRRVIDFWFCSILQLFIYAVLLAWITLAHKQRNLQVNCNMWDDKGSQLPPLQPGSDNFISEGYEWTQFVNSWEETNGGYWFLTFWIYFFWLLINTGGVPSLSTVTVTQLASTHIVLSYQHPFSAFQSQPIHGIFASLKHKSFYIRDSLVCLTALTLTLLLCFPVWFIYMSISPFHHWGFLQSRAEHFHHCHLQKPSCSPSKINESWDKLAPMKNVIMWRRFFVCAKCCCNTATKKEAWNGAKIKADKCSSLGFCQLLTVIHRRQDKNAFNLFWSSCNILEYRKVKWLSFITFIKHSAVWYTDEFNRGWPCIH